ncbi:MAG: hypothetical protein J5671_09620 [Bacteroidaceae bacterium]|nr:hypothetical protein [Bacteroidaceae bacterium]
MKKNIIIWGLISLVSVFVISACKGGQNVKEEEVVEEIDYTALVEQELPSVEDFVKTVDVFQKGTSDLLPTGKVWDNGEQSIRELLEPLNFTVERDTERFFISASKNCQFITKCENYIYSYAIDSVKTEGLAAACYFESMGDFYVKGEILLADTCVYDAYVERIKATGYEPTVNDFADTEDEEKYVLGDYYFKCSRQQKRISLHYEQVF